MTVELTEENGFALSQFNRLINEILRGRLNRNCFRPWEIEFLLEIDSSDLRPSARNELLRRYQKAVQRHCEHYTSPPPKWTDFLNAQRSRRTRALAETELPAALRYPGYESI